MRLLQVAPRAQVRLVQCLLAEFRGCLHKVAGHVNARQRTGKMGCMCMQWLQGVEAFSVGCNERQ